MSSHPHRPVTLAGRFAWPVCSKCGLVFLRNQATARAIRRGCADADVVGHSGRFGTRVTVQQGKAGAALPLERGWERWH